MNDEFIVSGYVDSQNSFVAMLRSKFVYRVSESEYGDKVSYALLAGGVGDDNISKVYYDKDITKTESEVNAIISLRKKILIASIIIASVIPPLIAFLTQDL